MEQRTATIPFDLETAKKINIGEIAGRIVTEKGQNRAEIVYEDNSSNCPLLVVIHSISVSADWFSATGKALSSENRLLLEVPEYITFKDGEVLSNKDGSYIFILNTHGKYLTSFYASLNQKGILKIEDGLSAWENQIEKYRFATESERQKLVDALKASKEPKAKEYLKRFFGIKEEPKYEFKPFDKVLVRKEGNKKTDGLYIIYEDGHAEPFTGDNSKDCVRYIGLKHRYMSFAISLTEHDIVQLLDDDSREESGSGTYYERECDALFDIDGRGNTERLVARNPKLRNLLEDGEYIPSLGQLNLMAHYMNELNKAFAYVSASPLFSTWYWSSTESSQAVAWYVVFSSGLTGTGNKHIGDMVRAVIDF